MAAFIVAHVRAALTGKLQDIDKLKPKRKKKQQDPDRPVRSAQAELRAIRDEFTALARSGTLTLEL